MKTRLLAFFATLILIAPSAWAMGKRPPTHPACAAPVNHRLNYPGSPGYVPAPATLDATGYEESRGRYAIPYALWTDGALKRRWIELPQGGVICTSNPDRWVFPVGTKLWKEFAFDTEGGVRKVETRYMEKLRDGAWLFATYEWDAQEREARLVGPQGRRVDLGGGRRHAIPGIYECASCHTQDSGKNNSRSDAVLGFDALQLSPHEQAKLPADQRWIDLAKLQGDSKLSHPFAQMPRILARSPIEREAIGRLHANCGHCHNPNGESGYTGLHLRYAFDGLETYRDAPIFRTAIGKGGSWGGDDHITPGNPERSYAFRRLQSGTMPPIGQESPDPELVEILRRWIESL